MLCLQLSELNEIVIILCPREIRVDCLSDFECPFDPMTYRFDCWKARPNFATITNFALAGYSAKSAKLSGADSGQP